MKDILFVNSRFLSQEITGVQRFSIELSRSLKRILGEKVQFIAPKNIIHSHIAKELNIIEFGIFTGHLWEQIDLPIFLRKHNSPMLLNLGNTAPIFYKNKTSTLHDVAYEKFPDTFNWKFKTFYKFAIPHILKSSIHIFTVSKFSKKEIEELYKIDSNKINIVYNAINEIFKPIKIKNNQRYILGVSSLNNQKNFHSMIDAFNQIADKNIKLYLVGGINRNFASTKLLDEIDKNQNIILKGRVDDKELVELYSNATCFVYPSLYEGFGIPPLEAQACGCPVICSNAASLPEVCSDSVVYFDPYNVQDIKDKIELVLYNEELQNELRRKGFENIKRFSWEKSANKIIEIIEGLK
ncbi:glycosyltransferase family 4 protein [Nitratifractor salsuginis]|uniref:Glycosyl transferase group 1 n=1 Tax=Nitratifractor salsuginis (strain DSM 16511 / JCM 12458 / E9I37-1) TaxID=749222 RepID=E6WZM6_NITSE|nr:glycosyltransferase family 1 protein [Nitratifractor salsuginis]ADV46667.1 glycosyl transferase group 1 [Nitratifractor salsuginis DSM 16511]